MARAPGDYGTGEDAIAYVLRGPSDVFYEAATFLTAWEQGDLSEYPDFLTWLDKVVDQD